MIRNLLEVPNKTVSALLKIGGPVIFYAGLLEIASASGLIKRLAERFSFIINKLFPLFPLLPANMSPSHSSPTSWASGLPERLPSSKH